MRIGLFGKTKLNNQLKLIMSVTFRNNNLNPLFESYDCHAVQTYRKVKFRLVSEDYKKNRANKDICHKKCGVLYHGRQRLLRPLQACKARRLWLVLVCLDSECKLTRRKKRILFSYWYGTGVNDRFSLRS